MKRLVFVVLISLVTALAFSVTALAHSGPEVTVKPLNPKAGQEVTISGEDLGANSKVEVRLVGKNVDLDLGEFQTDDDGGFTTNLTLPETLAAGTYQLKANGGESASIQLTLTAASADIKAPVAQPAVAQPAIVSQPAGAAVAGDKQMVATTSETAPALKERPLSEVLIAVFIFGALAGLGIFFGQRQGRHSHQP
ncbi:MAG TPA: hypothetical protein VH186_09370 [Chloroflexia bacterium]|nr:hypothetical protein [Chloroflexia bacterium]